MGSITNHNIPTDRCSVCTPDRRVFFLFKLECSTTNKSAEVPDIERHGFEKQALGATYCCDDLPSVQVYKKRRKSPVGKTLIFSAHEF